MSRYQALQSDEGVDDQTSAQVINGISHRKFEKAAMQIPSTFGIQKSSVSRKLIKASAKKLKAFQDRVLTEKSQRLQASSSTEKQYGEIYTR